jgi:hypothetical protein
MTSSLVRDDHARLIPHRAIGYTLGDDKQPRSLMGNLEYDGSSNFVATIRDLAKWDANFYEPKVGGQAFIDAMRVRGKLTDGTALDYAMGLIESETHGIPIEDHDGGFAGYRSVIQRYATERLTVAVLCNATEANPDALGDKVSALFVPQLSAPEPQPVAPPPAPAPFGFDLAAVAGDYVDGDIGEVRTVEATGGVLRMHYGHSPATPRELVPAGRGDLFVKGGHTIYRYEPTKGGRAAQLVRTAKAETPQTFVRTTLVDKLEGEKLGEYAGRYGGDELAHDVEIRVEDGRLVVAAVGGARRRLPFAPVAHDLFVMDDVGLRFERNARGKVVRLVASTDRARRVVLARR